MISNLFDSLKFAIGMALQTQLIVCKRTDRCSACMGVMAAQTIKNACPRVGAFIEFFCFCLVAAHTQRPHIVRAIDEKAIATAYPCVQGARTMTGLASHRLMTALEKFMLVCCQCAIVAIEADIGSHIYRGHTTRYAKGENGHCRDQY